ncbi:MAG TPA: Gfo/Idh/MocA family oxidoreductase, partial [Gemmatimonadota bacterium]|nr:Gfo/Idh/MocA family oxidoreductase [Gemmatimonadota bacterium]
MSHTSAEVRIGVLGCGQLALLAHLRTVRGLPGARLVAFAEPDDERRRAARLQAPEARALADYRDLLALDGVDAVIISLPPALHAEAAAAAHASGRHVYLEKPLATDAEGGRKALEAWRTSGREGMIGFNYRFNRLFREAKRLLDTRNLGPPVAVRTVFASAIRPQPGWMGDRRMGGGVLLDLASHHVDLIRWLFGEISEVGCSMPQGGVAGDTAALELVLRDGLPVQSFFSHRAVDEDRFEIYCEGGSMKLDRRHGLVVELSSGVDSAHRRDQLRNVWRAARNASYVMEKRRAFGGEPSWYHALTHFVEAARGDHPASPDFDDGFRSLEIVLAAEDSARDGRRTRVDRPDRAMGSDATGPSERVANEENPRMSVIMVTPDRFDRLR